MFTAIIENEGNTLVMEFPCKRYLMADHLGSIGVRKPAHEIKCMDEEDEPIKVKILGNGEFEQKLASFISSDDTLSLVNTMCEIYQNLPYQNKLDAIDVVMNDIVISPLGSSERIIVVIVTYAKHMIFRQIITPYFVYCRFDLV